MAEQSYVNTEIQAVTIAANGTVSSAVACTAGMILWKIVMPAAWDTANITLTEGYDGTNFAATYNDSNTQYTVTAGTSRVLTVPPSWGIGSVGYFKLVSTATQTSARTLYVVLRAI